LSHKNACIFYGVSKNTLWAWADNDKVIYKRTPGNQRVYFISTEIDESKKSRLEEKQTVVYCRVSSAKQKDDLERQCLYLGSKYPDCKIIKDIGSGLNYKRRGLFKLLEMSNKRIIDRVIVSSKDRLCRFGFELIEWVLLQNDTKIVVLDKIQKTHQQEFSEDILAILQVFACRWNGQRRYKTLENAKDKDKESNIITYKEDKRME
jgi:predicted site-specific integrase-resolvase